VNVYGTGCLSCSALRTGLRVYDLLNSSRGESYWFSAAQLSALFAHDNLILYCKASRMLAAGPGFTKHCYVLVAPSVVFPLTVPRLSCAVMCITMMLQIKTSWLWCVLVLVDILLENILTVSVLSRTQFLLIPGFWTRAHRHL
jgi:hypothetical protein